MWPQAQLWISFLGLSLLLNGITGFNISLKTNITTIEIGHSLRATCSLSNFIPPSGNYCIEFRRSEFLILQYDYPALQGSASTPRHPHVTINVHNYSDIDVLPLKFNESTYEVQLTQKTIPKLPAELNYARQYYCD